mmetsp:Transcript_30227/g.50884  ORF Transcript_30227/g.50884 Transcript_30227/m.50884 type:complete len:291 (+) Transcript_30227:332-1204(+)
MGRAAFKASSHGYASSIMLLTTVFHIHIWRGEAQAIFSKVDSGIETTLKDGFCVSRVRSRPSRHKGLYEPYKLNLEKYSNIIPPLQEREEFGALCEALGFRTGLEIGVQKGEFSKILLSKWVSCKKMYLLDPWEQQTTYVDIANVKNAKHNKFMQHARRNVALYQSEDATRIEFIRGYSTNKHSLFQERHLDFVYIDARHDYCGVYEDMQLYWPKVSCGGLLAGHDYLSADEVNFLTSGQNWALCANGTSHLGAVRAAVNDFANSINAQVLITYRERFNFNSWYIRKSCS